MALKVSLKSDCFCIHRENFLLWNGDFSFQPTSLYQSTETENKVMRQMVFNSSFSGHLLCHYCVAPSVLSFLMYFSFIKCLSFCRQAQPPQLPVPDI